MKILKVFPDVPYLPLPNRVSIVKSSLLAPLELTKTAFMIPMLPDGRVVFARNRRRGIEIPGGHIDPGETPTQAAHRECVEETGCWVSHIKAIGYLEMKSDGTVPEGWKYPHPLGYQQFFVGRVMYQTPYVENDECLMPQIIDTENFEEIANLSSQQTWWVSLAKQAFANRFNAESQ